MPRPASSSSSSLLYAACAQLFALRCVCDGLSIKATTYYDDVCAQPTGAMTHAYGNLHVDEDGFTTLGETHNNSAAVGGISDEAPKKGQRENAELSLLSPPFSSRCLGCGLGYFARSLLYDNMHN